MNNQSADGHITWLEEWQKLNVEWISAISDDLQCDGDANQLFNQMRDLENLIVTKPAATLEGVLAQLEFLSLDMKECLAEPKDHKWIELLTNLQSSIKRSCLLN